VALTIGVTEDGGLLAEGGADKKIRIRSGETLKVEREFRAHDGVVTGVLWHPKRPLLVRVSEDLTIKFWDRASWQVVEEIRGLSSVPEEMSVSSDGLALSVFFKRESKTRIYEPVSFRGEGK
jgi:WD40 repeat protein